MTTYSAIANSEIAVGAPITNSLMTKVRDNPLAIQEHDGTAPTIAYATAAGSATSASSAATAGTITNQGFLATLDSVSDLTIDPLSVGFSQLKKAIGSSLATQSLSAGGTWVPSLGYYNMSKAGGLGTPKFEIKIGISWYDDGMAGLKWCDGTNMRVIESSGTNQCNVAWQKLG